MPILSISQFKTKGNSGIHCDNGRIGNEQTWLYMKDKWNNRVGHGRYLDVGPQKEKWKMVECFIPLASYSANLRDE